MCDMAHSYGDLHLCVAACCSVLHCVVACCKLDQMCDMAHAYSDLRLCVAACCIVLQLAANSMKCATWRIHTATCVYELQRVAACCSLLQTR